jgi:hypothetical protein
MTAQEQVRIRDAHRALPDSCRSRPASETELLAFEKEFGPIPDDYRWYLAICGGGVVRSEWLDDIEKLKKSHVKFRREAAMANGWKKKSGFLIGWDGSGNPVSIDQSTGEILVEDHDFGGVHVVASSLAEFCLKSVQKKSNQFTDWASAYARGPQLILIQKPVIQENSSWLHGF